MNPHFTWVMFALLLLAFGLSGCSSKPALVRTVEVKVPVYIVPAPPAALAACGEIKPGFRFYSPSPTSKDVLILEKDQLAFQRWVEEKNRCIKAWKEWGKPQ